MGFLDAGGPYPSSSYDPGVAPIRPRDDRKYYMGLAQRRIDLVAVYDEILNSAGETLNEEERKQADAVQLDILDVEERIAAEEIRREERRQQALDRGPQQALPANITGLRDQPIHRSGNRPGDPPPGKPATYESMFGPATDTHGFEDFGDYVQAVTAGFHPNLQAAVFERGGSGGYLVPENFTAMILNESLEDEIVRPRATVFPMTSNVRKIAGFRHKDGSAGQVYGGLTGGWTPELGEIATSQPEAEGMQLIAKKLAMLTQFSNEVLNDAPDLERLYSQVVTEGMAFFLDSGFLTGGGAGEPLGVLSTSNPALIVVAKETAQVADTVMIENLVKLYGRAHPRSKRRGVWVVNSDAVPELMTMTTIGPGGIFIPAMNETDGGFTIFGRPVLFTEHVPTLGDQGDVSFIDFTQYGIGLVGNGLSMQTSQHLGFSTDSTWIRAIIRADGMPLWDAPVTPATGATLSPFVTLAERT